MNRPPFIIVIGAMLAALLLQNAQPQDAKNNAGLQATPHPQGFIDAKNAIVEGDKQFKEKHYDTATIAYQSA